jgi:hypothetical protein
MKTSNTLMFVLGNAAVFTAVGVAAFWTLRQTRKWMSQRNS